MVVRKFYEVPDTLGMQYAAIDLLSTPIIPIIVIRLLFKKMSRMLLSRIFQGTFHFALIITLFDVVALIALVLTANQCKFDFDDTTF